MPELSTALNLWRELAQSCQCGATLTATDASTTAITVADYPAQTNRTNASNRRYEGDEIYWAGAMQTSTLTAAMTAAATTCTVASGTGYATSTARPYYIGIDDEWLLVTLSSATFTVLARGCLETRAVAHVSGATVYGPKQTPNPNGVGAFVASTGVLTPSVTYNIDPGTTGEVFVFTRSVRLQDIQIALNKALREFMFEDYVPLTLITDGDMRSPGYADWTASGSPTVSKVTNTNAIEGPRSLRVLATVANDYVQSATILVDPTNAQQWYVRALVRADVGTATLRAYDVTNSAEIEAETTATGRGWQIVDFPFSLPATCRALAFQLESDSSTSDAYWAYVQGLQLGAHEVVAPSWMSQPNMLREVLGDRSGRNRWDDPDWYPVHHHLVPDISNPNNQFKIHLDSHITGPLWLHVNQQGVALTGDAQTTFVDRRLLIAKAAMILCDDMANRIASPEGQNWRRMWKKKKDDYAYLTMGQPMPQVELTSSRRNW